MDIMPWENLIAELDIDECNFLVEGPSSFSFSSCNLGIINEDTRNNTSSIFFDLDTSGQNDDKDAPRACDKTETNGVCVTKSPLEAQNRVMAERVRRERLSRQFVALSALIPGLTKVDKVSILGDAITYLKLLEERTKMLEEQINQKSVNKSHNSEGLFKEGVLQIEARVSDKDVIVRVHCRKKKGLDVQILKELEKLNLNVVNTCVLPFGLAINMTVVAKGDADFCMTVKDLVRQLRSIF